jgi:hypothetical protein
MLRRMRSEQDSASPVTTKIGLQLPPLALLLVALVGCGSVPTHNLSNLPISIDADGQNYVTCGAYSLGESGGLGKTSYSLSFKDVGEDNAKVELKGVEKLKITELPAMVDAPMPAYLPDIKADHPSDGGSYSEGSEYTWKDGTTAKVQNGTWVAVKRKNTVCDKR